MNRICDFINILANISFFYNWFYTIFLTNKFYTRLRVYFVSFFGEFSQFFFRDNFVNPYIFPKSDHLFYCLDQGIVDEISLQAHLSFQSRSSKLLMYDMKNCPVGLLYLLVCSHQIFIKRSLIYFLLIWRYRYCISSFPGM